MPVLELDLHPSRYPKWFWRLWVLMACVAIAFSACRNEPLIWALFALLITIARRSSSLNINKIQFLGDGSVRCLLIGQQQWSECRLDANSRMAYACVLLTLQIDSSNKKVSQSIFPDMLSAEQYRALSVRCQFGKWL